MKHTTYNNAHAYNILLNINVYKDPVKGHMEYNAVIIFKCKKEQIFRKKAK